jgi:hypothetical protein
MLRSFFLLVQLALKFSILCCVLQKVLAAHGASKVSAYVTHAVFPKQSYERFLTSNSGNCQISTSVLQPFRFQALVPHHLFLAAGSGDQFAYFWITDSCPHTVKAIAQQHPFEVLSLAGSIVDALQI